MESRNPEPTMDASSAGSLSQLMIPTEQQLALLSLDYLRDLRRAYSANEEQLQKAEGMNADWLTLAIYALNRALPGGEHTDPWRLDRELPSGYGDSNILANLPSLDEMNKELLYEQNPYPEEPDLDPYAWYDYDDAHPSNQQRFYVKNGLAEGPPLMLGEIAAVGLGQMQARTRGMAEKDLVGTALFEQFKKVVESKGFFKDSFNEMPYENPVEEEDRLMSKERFYEQRLAMVIAKFRTKLATKAQLGDGAMATVLAEQHLARRLKQTLSLEKLSSDSQKHPRKSTAKADFEKAEKFKFQGNACMQKKDYKGAVVSYTEALKLSATGPSSHVYYSNRAAALLSMKKFQGAIADSERSLRLKPTYGKAHARLGLAHFLRGDYKQAKEAYTIALKYEPDNKASKSYLEKASQRLAQENSDKASIELPSSFSFVSEWDRSAKPDQSAEKMKAKGNQHMAQREYELALDAYSKAIELSPNGAQTHVYYSNRSAAHCYLEQYEEAAEDSKKSLELNPTYGKAHARLGLSRYFLNDLPGAIRAYETALKYDPSNAASKSYLAKAKIKMEEQQIETQRLLEDPAMKLLAKKATSNQKIDLMEDPEMQMIAKKALSDPTMMKAVMATQHR